MFRRIREALAGMPARWQWLFIGVVLAVAFVGLVYYAGSGAGSSRVEESRPKSNTAEEERGPTPARSAKKEARSEKKPPTPAKRPEPPRRSPSGTQTCVHSVGMPFDRVLYAECLLDTETTEECIDVMEDFAQHWPERRDVIEWMKENGDLDGFCERSKAEEQEFLDEREARRREAWEEAGDIIEERQNSPPSPPSMYSKECYKDYCPSKGDDDRR